MHLSDMFLKPVNRPIEGVIKADDETSLRLEMEEYVLTSEIARSLENFLEAYNNYQNANAVWISGFFGSGKSHLLKMLALLLENRDLDGAQALDLFLPKCADNAFLRASLKKAVSFPSKSILFNIDQKAVIINRVQEDALLAVFVKVFNEMCGYYGKVGYIAQFERDLDSRGLYGDFKQAFLKVSGRPWEEGRQLALLEKKNIAKAYALTLGEEEGPTDILNHYSTQYKVSIDDFAENVRIYIERQAKNFRLNFFVDEVGQFIAENTTLMLTLQTIAESLATKCRGRAWITVTAQEDMSKVLDDMNARQAHDFSKIQARFANRMKLTSQDVDEVIQKRLLQKNKVGKDLLKKEYDARSNSFRTLFGFPDGSHRYQNFEDSEHFIFCYPFIPYQFELFQSAIQNLSTHNAFEGRHSSVGERSMLGVFQQVAIQINDQSLGNLATFDLFFEGIRASLKTQIQDYVLKAENNPDVNPFTRKILKVLFLVKYVKEFKPTVSNLCVLMLNSFDTDMTRLKKDIEEALIVLERQTYIQRNGESYEYLTDEEKDVELEIKNTELEKTDVPDFLASLIFDRTLGENKIDHDIGRSYPFAKKLDGNLYGKEHELAINVITLCKPDASSEAVLQMQNTGKKELMVILPPEQRLMNELFLYKRTEKFTRQNYTTVQQDSRRRILSEKAKQNQEREERLTQMVKDLLAKASLYVSGTPFAGEGNAKARLISGFKELIARVYSSLPMLNGINYTKTDPEIYLRPDNQAHLNTETTPLSEAEKEILNILQQNSKIGMRSTVKNVLERFQGMPYGWPDRAFLCLLAKLYARGKVEISKDGEMLEGNALGAALRNSSAHGALILEPQVEFSISQVNRLKRFYCEFFEVPPDENEAKALAGETNNELKKIATKLGGWLEQTGEFPFLEVLREPLKTINAAIGHNYAWYFTEFNRQAEDLIEMKKDLLEPVNDFMTGTLKDIYREARAYLREHKDNFPYIEGDEAADMKASLDDPDCFRGSNKMRQVKSLLETLKTKVNGRLPDEREAAKKKVEELKQGLKNMTGFPLLSPDVQAEIDKVFRDFSRKTEQEKLIPVIRESARRFEEGTYKRLLAQVCALESANNDTQTAPTLPATATKEGRQDTPVEDQEAPPPAPKVEIISLRETKVSFDKPLLSSEEDVETYLDSMRTALLEAIREGKRIQV